MNKDEYSKMHFPEVDPGVKPCGNQILVQLRTLRSKVGSILIAPETQDFNKHNTQLARLVAVGNIAFRHRETGETWREGAWAEVGDIIVAPKFGGFRFEVPLNDGTSDTAVFAVFNDYDVKLVVESNFTAFDQIL